MLAIIGFAVLALVVVAVLAALGKVDIDRSVGVAGYSFEIQLNERVPLGIMVSKNN